MPRAFTPKVVTGNALLEGDVIYLTEADGWSRDLAEAEVLDDEAVAQLRLLDAQSRPGEVVGAYLADVSPGANGPEPTHFREDFRRTGPSNYSHGKQEQRSGTEFS
ncbi:hypothetical protein FIU97_05455 [Roseivivax sp. THAF40]|uniref:DUF2849 domain-containing protein n=1 Tax=unclassified Roseivivax TaxID=2639302 RepID=UPI0012692A8B|nr:MULTISPECIES: DUF2849 domain-containing protein [unclassified Roseivivax]QFS82220.1 hypothetical protein FIV09_05195 [Roseivivax sp. THAF197b]QFT46020.1 hypothetical protein FIU97_05455 [Roseivivax sp. THAF40]